MCEVIGAPNSDFENNLKAFGEFIGCDKIVYDDLGNGEDYTIHKGDDRFQLRVRGNCVDGGFMHCYLMEK